MYNFKQICSKPFTKEPEYLLDQFSTISRELINASFEIKQIKSASVFPEIAHNADKYVLYWDLQYWDFFEGFLLELSHLLENNLYLNSFVDHVCAIYFDYLSLKLLHIPALAYCIQVCRERKFGSETAYFSPNILGKDRIIGDIYWNQTYLARLLAFNHELYHLYFNLNPNKSFADHDRLHKLVDLYMDGIKADSERNQIILENLQKLQNSSWDKFLEEAACDYRALIQTVYIIKQAESGSEQNLIQHFWEILDAFHINQVLLSNLSDIAICWEAVYKAYISADNTDEALKIAQPFFDRASQSATMRNIIIPDFFDKFICKNFGISSYVNILDNDLIRVAFQKVTDIVADIDFMVFAIKESLRLMQLPYFNPFEMKDIVLGNAEYQ